MIINYFKGVWKKMSLVIGTIASSSSQLIIVVLLLSTPIKMIGQNNDSIFDVDFYESIKKSITKKKPILLYFYFDGCGACVKMNKSTFSAPEVQSFINANLIACKINTYKGDGPKFASDFQISSYPSFVIIDSIKTILGKNSGYMNAAEFIDFCIKSIDSSTSYDNLISKRKIGEITNEQLFNYCMMLYNAGESDRTAINEYINSQEYSQLNQKHNIDFIYANSVTELKPNFDITSPAFRYLFSSTTDFYKYYDSAQINSRIVCIALNSLNTYLKKGDEVGAFECISILNNYISEKPYRITDKISKGVFFYNTGNHYANAILLYAVSDDTVLMKALLDGLTYQKLNNNDFYIDLAWRFSRITSNPYILSYAEKWLENLNDEHTSFFYYTYSLVLFKLRKYENAAINANLAIKLAKENNEDYAEIMEHLEKIESEIKIKKE